MKFTDLSLAKQQLLKAFIEGEIIQHYTPATGWKDTDMGTFFGALEFSHPDWLRVKSKGTYMKFTDLSTHKQELLKSYINGETIEYFSDVLQTWRCTSSTLETLEALDDKNLRVKPKEPVVTYLYSGVGIHGNIYAGEFESLGEVVFYYPKHTFHSYVKRTFHDGVFIKAEIVQK